MTVRKMMVTGLVAVAAVLALTTDAQALGKRKKSSGCSSCATAAPTGCSGCGVAYAGGPGGYAMVAPEAMPATGTATTTQPNTVTPATGTAGGTVVPATGIVTPQGTVIQAGGYIAPNGQYVLPAGYTTAVQPSGTTTSTRRGIFRR